MSKSHQKENKLTPDPNQDWKVSREQFLKSIAIGSAAINLPWLQACTNDPVDFGDISPLNSKQFTALRSLLETLFPNDGNGPSALDVNADRYIIWVLNDPLLDQSENQYIIDKLDKFIEQCMNDYRAEFSDLSYEDKEMIVRIIIDDWGESWVSRILTLIFEALLTDPKYGGNPDYIGWEWLKHDPGVPRPTNDLIYPAILER